MKPPSFVQKSEYASSEMVSLIIRHIWVTIKIVESVFGQLRKIISISTATLLSGYIIKQPYQLFVEFVLHINKNNRTNIDIDETKCNDWGFIFMKISSLKWLLPSFDMADTFNKRSTTILVNHTLSIEYQQFNFMFNPHNDTWTSQLQYCLRHWTMKIKCY